MLGTNEDDALFFHAFGKARVFRQKAVAWVHCLRAGLFASGNDFVGHQIAFAAGRGANVDGFVCQHHMARVFVCFRINSHGFDAHFAGSLNHTASDFATVGDEDFCKHYFPLCTELV